MSTFDVASTGEARALIGHTGFVGSNLLAQSAFDEVFNSENVESMRGRKYASVVCAGARAEKWRINQDASTDWRNIQRLMNVLETISAQRMILISTIDVYPQPLEVDEHTRISPQDHDKAYGKHRLLLELFCRERFLCTIARLPSLFGKGLKKNVIYDFLHDNNVDEINADSAYQFYDLAHLSTDLEIATANGLEVINLATEPVTVKDVSESVFGVPFTNRPSGGEPANYDMRTLHGRLFGTTDQYLYKRNEVLTDLRAFVEAQRH